MFLGGEGNLVAGILAKLSGIDHQVAFESTFVMGRIGGSYTGGDTRVTLYIRTRIRIHASRSRFPRLRNIRADTWVPYDSMDTQDLRYR